MPSPQNLRALAQRMLALAIVTANENLVEPLVLRAIGYLDQAVALEAAQTEPAVTDAEKEE
jgi:hypothetical protein